MFQKSIKITGWVLTVIIAVPLLMSSVLKLTNNPMAVEQASSIGIDAATYQLIGLIEILSLILFIIPRTGVLGALLLIAYMGGAIVTHLQHQQPITIAVGLQILIWIATFIRFPEIKQRLFSNKNFTNHGSEKNIKNYSKSVA